MMGRMKKKPANRRQSSNKTDTLRISGADLDARRAQRLATLAGLKGQRTPLQIVALGAQAADYADQAVAEATQRQPPQPPTACAPGCAWCCRQRVGVAVPEIARIVDYLHEHMSAGERENLVMRINEHCRSGTSHQRSQSGLPCPLLVNDRCSVYPVRPLTCRGFNSSDALRCQAAVMDKERTQVPVYPPQIRLTSVVLDGMRAGLKEAGLHGDLLELAGALHIALTVPNALTDWLAGQPVFAAARLE